MKPYLICPTCGSDDVMKNGMTRRGKQNHKCRDCGHQFVENPQWQAKDTDTLVKIELLLLERISLAGIARVMDVSESWLLALCEPPVRCRRTKGHSHPETSRKTYRPNR
jgi:transposase-like protein